MIYEELFRCRVSTSEGFSNWSQIVTLEIELTNELESRLRIEAARQGVSKDRAAVELLNRHLPQTRKGKAAAMLLQWAEEDSNLSEAELEANRAVLRSIDENRLSERKLFEHLADEAS